MDKEYVFIDELVLSTPLKVETPSEFYLLFIVPYDEADQEVLEVY